MMRTLHNWSWWILSSRGMQPGVGFVVAIILNEVKHYYYTAVTEFNLCMVSKTFCFKFFLTYFLRKRYEKAEVEYVTAKLDLHKKTEVKEQLTEHLCAIIQQNELRKAHKLEELMQQLQLQATEEELERQKKEEEEEEQKKRRRSCVETQRDGKQGNGSAENQVETVQSSKDCRPTEEEAVKEEREGGDVQQEHHVKTEPAKTEQDCKTLENCVQSELVAS